MAAEHEWLRPRVVARALEQLGGGGQRLRHRRRPPSEVHREHPGQPTGQRVRAPLGEIDQAVDRLPGGRRPADGHAREVREPTGAEKRLVVVVLGEQFDPRARLSVEPVDGRGRGRQLELDLGPAHVGERPGHFVDAPFVELVEGAKGLGVAPGFHERLAVIHHHPSARGMVRGQHVRRASEQPRRRVHVSATGSPSAGLGEPFGRAHSERADLVVHRAELRPVAVALLEVVAEDLLVLGDSRRRPVARASRRTARAASPAASSRSPGRRRRGRGCA